MHRLDFLKFLGPLIPLFWTSGDVSAGFQSQRGQPYSHLAEAYMLYVPCDSPLVQNLPTSWQPAWQPSQSLPCTCKQALEGLETGTSHTTCSTDRAIPAWLRLNALIGIQIKNTLVCVPPFHGQSHLDPICFRSLITDVLYWFLFIV